MRNLKNKFMTKLSRFKSCITNVFGPYRELTSPKFMSVLTPKAEIIGKWQKSPLCARKRTSTKFPLLDLRKI